MVDYFIVIKLHPYITMYLLCSPIWATKSPYITMMQPNFLQSRLMQHHTIHDNLESINKQDGCHCGILPNDIASLLPIRSGFNSLNHISHISCDVVSVCAVRNLFAASQVCNSVQLIKCQKNGITLWRSRIFGQPMFLLIIKLRNSEVKLISCYLNPLFSCHRRNLIQPKRSNKHTGTLFLPNR